MALLMQEGPPLELCSYDAIELYEFLVYSGY